MGIRNWSFGLGKGLGWLWLFPAIGTLLLAGALAVQVHRRSFEATASKAEGTVVELALRESRDSDGRRGDTYCPVVRYRTAAGREIEFVSRTCSQPPAYDVGERVRVLYRPDKPYGASLDGFAERWLGTLVLGGIGLIFSLIGWPLVLIPLRRRRLDRTLPSTGRPIDARIVGIAQDYSVRVNGRRPWRISAQWQDPATGKVHVLESAPVWFDPAPFVQRDSVRVFIDPQRPSRYSMDIGFLPEAA